MKRIMALTGVFGLSIISAVAAAQVGQPGPEFTGKDFQGKTHQLSDYKGKIVVLESYNLDCPFCANHYKTGAMQELQQELAAKGIVWLLVNSVHAKNPSYRDPEAARREWSQHKIKATAWIDDHSGEIGKAYGMKTTPHMFVINKEGVLAYQGAIDDAPVDTGDPRKARSYVRLAVEQLLAGKPVAVPSSKPYGCGVKFAD